jgi:predicted Na+-dependent transporter
VTIRRFLPDLVLRYSGFIRSSSLFLLLVLVGLTAVDQCALLRAICLDATILVVLFTVMAAVIGVLTGVGLRVGKSDRDVLAIEFAIRNLGAIALIASSTVGRPELLAFGAVVVIVQFPLFGVLLTGRLARSKNKVTGVGGPIRSQPRALGSRIPTRSVRSYVAHHGRISCAEIE